MRTSMAILVSWMLLCTGCGRRVPPPLQEDEPEMPGLSKEETKAWQKADAVIGWLGPHRKYGFLEFRRKNAEVDAEQAVPAFHVVEWRKGMLATLPMPPRMFGLDLG